MKKDDILRQIKEKALKDAKNRRDRRFICVMGFLVAKGFLKTNLAIPLLPNKKLKLDDAIWAGVNVEPRILEVLPAATLRLEKHFDLNNKKHANLAKVVDQLRKNHEQGDAFMGIPYEKFKVWTQLRLKDGRVKTLAEKKVLKTYRLKPAVALEIKKRARQWSCTESEVLERALASTVK